MSNDTTETKAETVQAALVAAGLPLCAGEYVGSCDRYQNHQEGYYVSDMTAGDVYVSYAFTTAKLESNCGDLSDEYHKHANVAKTTLRDAGFHVYPLTHNSSSFYVRGKK